ncbi:sulfatase-like hydrolase/transferase [Enterovirga sp. GCM10030262]|uniref:sulfatase-like hydrolase/transferase n=1 Tax=Enterovirga sp. GCM10030262 TaxID=3273391 RepID=UPI00361233D7
MAIRRPGLAVPSRLATWILCWIVLPNLPFMAMWVVGGPPRYPEILAAGTIGLIVRKARFPIKLATFAVMLGYSVLAFISTLFSLSLASLFYSIRFLIELRPGASIEYVMLAALLAATLAGGWKLLRKPTDFVKPWQLLCAAAAIFAFAGLDLWMSAGSRGSYTRTAPAGAAFSSATSQAGFGALAGTGNNLLIVMVEALGMPKDPSLQARLFAPWRRADIAHRYDVRSGTSPFFGSTTSGELRELCGRWGDYAELKTRADPGCLPAKLAANGYETTAIHSFEGGFFDRTDWYPNIGFQSLLFRDGLFDKGAEACSGVFPGACDRDVPRIIAERLKQPGKPQFIYWLTVNSHLPVAADATLGTEHCARFDAELAESQAMACRLFSLWNGVSVSLAEMLADSDLPPTDVLIVGDHAPPFFDRRQRALFHRDRVPWILLKHKVERD